MTFSTMFSLLPRAAACILLAATTLAQAQEASPRKHPFDFAPSAELSYTIKAQQKGIPLEGDAIVRWTVSSMQFSVISDTRAMLLGKVLETRSQGGIDEYGLAPASFTEKRLRRDATHVTFDRAANTIRFSTSDTTTPIKGGEQDRSSIVWQLVAIARAAPAKFKAGSEWKFIVAAQRNVDPWTFKVLRREKIETGVGTVNAVHVVRVEEASDDQQLDIWLAPSMEWYPVKLRFSEQGKDFIEQTLVKIDKKP